MKLLAPIEYFSDRSRRVLFTSVVLAILVMAIGSVSRARRSASRATILPAPVLGRIAPQIVTPLTPIHEHQLITIDGVRITLRRTGFQPKQITRSKGPFLLSIDNLSEMGEMNFRLLRENGASERDLLHKNDKFRLRQVVDLQPGRYVLVEVNHPEWTCSITIAAQ